MVIGLNGSGKSSLIRIAALYEHLSRGTVDDARRGGSAAPTSGCCAPDSARSPAMADLVRPNLSAAEVVMCGRFAALEPLVAHLHRTRTGSGGRRSWPRRAWARWPITRWDAGVLR